ncbi:MAG: TetR/AcrR family transcriptional regulator [Roseobacter sp.]
MGLRERQKQDRKHRIVASAKELFVKQGFERTTIESIAEAAEVSGVTVHNYYGTKAGILLALVVENDERLLDVLEEKLDENFSDLVELTCRFSTIVQDHALGSLEKSIWRQVIAAVTLDAQSPFGKAYTRLDQKLASVLVRKIEQMQKAGDVPRRVNAIDLGKALFQLQNARFIELVRTEGLTGEDSCDHLRADLEALFLQSATTHATNKPAVTAT